MCSRFELTNCRNIKLNWLENMRYIEPRYILAKLSHMNKVQLNYIATSAYTNRSVFRIFLHGNRYCLRTYICGLIANAWRLTWTPLQANELFNKWAFELFLNLIIEINYLRSNLKPFRTFGSDRTMQSPTRSLASRHSSSLWRK